MPSPSPASASTSTLFTTPQPLTAKELEHELPENHSIPPPHPSPGVGVTPNRMSANGFIEPHHSHLPRRRRMTPGRGASIAGAQAHSPSTPPANSPRSPTTSPAAIPQAVLAQEGLRHPTSTPTPSPPNTSTTNTTEPPTSLSLLLATPETPLPPSQASNLLSLSHGPSIGPSKTNLPRRKRRSTQRYSKQDKQDCRCMQPLKGCGGGKTIDVGFLDEDAEAEVVLLSGEDELRLSLSQPEAAVDGTCSLDDPQLREACAFIHRCCSTRTRILTPRARREEAISIAALYLSSLASSTPTSSASQLNDLIPLPHPSAPIDIETDLPVPDVYSYTPLHLLVMGWHDEGGWAERKGPYIQGGNSDSDNVDHKERKGGETEGLRDEWRGVLSFEGMQRLATLVQYVNNL